MQNFPYFGELFSLVTAFSWAIAVILFKKSGESVHPIGLNILKNFLGIFLFGITLFIQGIPLFHPNLNQSDYWILILSGVLGIGVADTLFFMALNRMGASLMAIVDCLYSPSIIFFSFLLLREKLSLVQLMGAFLIISAILASSFRRNQAPSTSIKKWNGIFLGSISMLVMAYGIVIAKPILDRTPLIVVIEIRLIAGLLILLPYLWLHPARREILHSITSMQKWAYTLSGSLMGGYLSMLFWITGMKYTQTSISSALNQMSNIFIFILAAVFLKETLNRYKIIGIALAVFGALMVLWG